MALTKIGTDGVKDDAVTSDKVANSINTAIAANTAKTQTTINNNADNRVITGSGTANTLNGESNVIIDSSGRVGIGDSSPDRELVVKNASSNATVKIEASNASSSQLFFSDTDAENVAKIGVFHGSGQATSDAMHFELGGSTKMILQTGGGISFNGDTAAANALDDYEEGTFTPSIYYQNTSGITVSTNSASAKYTKIGRIVWIIGAINWTVSGSPVNDNIAILGLPFATNTGQVGTNSTRFAGANITLQNTSDQSFVYMATGYGNNGINLAIQQDLGNRANEIGGNSGMIVMFQLWYHTA